MPSLRIDASGRTSRDILVDHPGADHAELAGADLRAVDGGGRTPSGEVDDPLLDLGMTDPGIAGEHDQLRRILDQRRRRQILDPLAEGDDRLAVGDAGHAAQHHRGVELLGEFEGQAGELLALLRVGRLQHRHLGKFGVVAAVLLVLRGVHLRIVGRHQHQPAPHPGVGEGEEGIGGNVDADVLHASQGAGAAERGADGNFEGDLLVRRPGGVDFRIIDDVFENFGTGSARIGGGDLDPRLEGAAGNGFITGENGLIHSFSFNLSGGCGSTTLVKHYADLGRLKENPFEETEIADCKQFKGEQVEHGKEYVQSGNNQISPPLFHTRQLFASGN